MSNRTYDTLKFLGSIILPFAAMVVSILGAFGLTECAEIVTAIATAVSTFAGIALNELSRRYHEQKEAQ